MVAATTRPVRRGLPEQRMLVSGVRWKDYVILREALDTPSLKMTYLEGDLELMSPSGANEKHKKIIARLVETYAYLLRLPFNGYGSTTFRKEAKKRGVEPDECWVLGRTLDEGDYPDIVLEVIETAPLLDKLRVYDGLAIPEVWLFEEGRFTIHHRRKKGGYEQAGKSALLPELDFSLLARLVEIEDQQAALEELTRRVKAAAKPRAKKRR
ncbi:MAG: Uma2 family endonuclease [Labilithrix sp.]|nr:Uma2 family endonuclease [Labilithrix sp.]